MLIVYKVPLKGGTFLFVGYWYCPAILCLVGVLQYNLSTQLQGPLLELFSIIFPGLKQIMVVGDNSNDGGKCRSMLGSPSTRTFRQAQGDSPNTSTASLTA